MSKQVIKVHTIAEWMALDPAIRPVILSHIKLKDRLYRWLKAKIESGGTRVEQPTWVKCLDCGGVGHILLEPRYDGLHPSQIGQPCLLKTYFDMKGVAKHEKYEARLQLTFDLGHAIHRMFQNYGLKGAWGEHYRKEVPISGDFQELAAQLDIEGSADAENILLIDDIPNSPYAYEVGIVHEYKSSNENNFKKLTRPKPEHLAQAMLYSAALNRPVVVYMYLNKNDSNLQDFPVEFNPDLWNKVGGKAHLLKQYSDRNELPPAEVGFHCNDCGFNYQCEAYQTQVLKKAKV